MRCGWLTTLRHPLGSPPEHWRRPAGRGVDRQGRRERVARFGFASTSGAASDVQAVPVEECGVGLAGEESLVAQYVHEQIAVGHDAVDRAARQCAGQAEGSLVAGRAQAMTLASIGS